MVYPSGSERATDSAAILLLPPVRFSTTTCWRQISASRFATKRVTASMPPPAAIGQITRTTRFGNEACPRAASGRAAEQRDELAPFPLTEMHPIPSRAGSRQQDTGLQRISQLVVEPALDPR